MVIITRFLSSTPHKKSYRLPSSMLQPMQLNAVRLIQYWLCLWSWPSILLWTMARLTWASAKRRPTSPMYSWLRTGCLKVVSRRTKRTLGVAFLWFTNVSGQFTWCSAQISTKSTIRSIVSYFQSNAFNLSSNTFGRKKFEAWNIWTTQKCSDWLCNCVSIWAFWSITSTSTCKSMSLRASGKSWSKVCKLQETLKKFTFCTTNT